MKNGAIVLCGGRSSRMGRPKALLTWRDKPMVAHVVGVLRQVVDQVVVVTSADLDLPPLDAVIVRDRQPELGPLAGIREGLEATPADLAYVTGTDAPFLTAAFVKAMLAFGVAAAPVVDGVIQPLSAVYPKSAATFASTLIATGQLAAHGLLEAAGFRKVRPEELPDLASIRNLNTPDDYFKALKDDRAIRS